MAKTLHSMVALILLFHILMATVTAAGRPIGDTVKHPEMLFNHDRGYLIPGIGRGIKPKCKKGFNPFTYNPVTGDNNGIPGLTLPGGGGLGGTGILPGGGGGVGGGSYVPGGDDTLVPNPGVEVPNPGAGGAPVPARP